MGIPWYDPNLIEETTYPYNLDYYLYCICPQCSEAYIDTDFERGFTYDIAQVVEDGGGQRATITEDDSSNPSTTVQLHLRDPTSGLPIYAEYPQTFISFFIITPEGRRRQVRRPVCFFPLLHPTPSIRLNLFGN
jgi:hypothetical protein